MVMAKYDKEKDQPGDDEFDDIEDDVIRDEVDRIFKKYPHDHIRKLEEIGFEYFDDEFDEEEQEEAVAKPLNSNQQHLISFFNGNIPLSDETLEIFFEERRSKHPNLPLIRKYFKDANKHLLSLLLHGLHRYPVNVELLSDLAFFHEYQSVLGTLIDHYTIACKKQGNLEVFSELVMDFYYATIPDGYDALYAMKELYSVGTDKRKIIDFLNEIENAGFDEEDVEF